MYTNIDLCSFVSYFSISFSKKAITHRWCPKPDIKSCLVFASHFPACRNSQFQLNPQIPQKMIPQPQILPQFQDRVTRSDSPLGTRWREHSLHFTLTLSVLPFEVLLLLYFQHSSTPTANQKWQVSVGRGNAQRNVKWPEGTKKSSSKKNKKVKMERQRWRPKKTL